MKYIKKGLSDVDVRGKKVLVRCDFNVPLENGEIASDIRIISALPTIQALLRNGAAVILCSHLGRPRGRWEAQLSLLPVARRLEELLNQKIGFAQDVVGVDARRACASLNPGEIVLLENLRFEQGEENNDPDFARQLAALADLYVNDAFGTAHRGHASNLGVSKFLPSVCGYLMEKEIGALSKALEAPERPYIAIVGGAKIQDKLTLIEKLVEQCDSVLIVGAMAYTFYKALGGRVGNSLIDEKNVEVVGALYKKVYAHERNLYIPLDNLVADRFEQDADTRCVQAFEIPEGYEGVDIGPLTAERYSQIIKRSKTIVWNGPAGAFEIPGFEKGTREIAQAVAESGAFTIVGGGDTASAVSMLGLSDRMSHISTGGGASLEFIEGRELPGIACLLDA